jgi:TPR repeat protein
MTRAAKLGHKPAVNALATSYLQGGFDFTPAERESAEAVSWIQAAAAIDLLPAIDRLVVAYRKGELGLAIDVKRAAELEARAKALRGERGKITKKRGK